MANKDSGRMTWRSGDKKVFWAKEDDPIYKRGWTIGPAKSTKYSGKNFSELRHNREQDFPAPEDRD